MDDRTWTIVQFAADLTVEAIPTSWIQGECCHWPPYKQEKISTSIKKCESLNTNWPRHNIKIFRNATFDDYAKARQKAKIAESCSDLNSESECKEKRKRIQKILSSSSDESFEETERINLPPPPKLTKLSLKPKASTSHISYFPDYADSSLNLSQSRSEETLMEKAVLPRTSETVMCQTVSNTALDKNENNKEWPDNNENRRTCCLHHENKILVEIKNQNHMLRGIMVDVLKEIRELKNHKTETSTSIFVKYPGIKFPIENDEDLNKFEEELKNEENFIEAVNEVAKFGGSNPYNFIKRTMSSISSDSVLTNYSWLGRKGKKSLENSLVAKALLQSAEKCLNCNKKEVELAIQSFVKRSSERMKSKENKKAGA